MANETTQRTGLEWFSSLPACLLLLLVVLFSTSSDIHNQMLSGGEALWSGYFKLREDPSRPECNPDRSVDQAVDARVRQLQSSQQDSVTSLLGEATVDRAKVRESVENAIAQCREKHADFATLKERITPSVKAYRAVEGFIGDIIAAGLTAQPYILIAIVMICAATATLSRHHIAMRPMETRLDYTLSYTLQTIANVMLMGSSVLYRQVSHDVGAVSLEQELLHDFWIVCFAVLALASLYRLIRPPSDLIPGGDLGRAGLAVPLYTGMCLISGSYFVFIGHGAGIGVYLDKLMELSSMFLNVALYVWVGMMLKQTRLATLVFNVFRPWRLPPEALAVVAVAVAAIPTAYTGASGIFVIAAGAVIYSELRAAGARRHLALAASAMSGSLGVVLRPCLLVVIIAYLNREVTTDDLFGWGVWVFLLTAGMFLLISNTINRQSRFEPAPFGEAMPAMARELLPLVPYALVITGVVLFYSLALDVGVDEFSAPRILPVIMLAILVYEHFAGRRRPAEGPRQPPRGFERSIRAATNDTTAEIGALLLLFGLSVSLGGVIERAELMQMFPASFDSPWTAMLLMVVVLVILGMIMDAFGAVILVSATVASMAYASGVNPIHFWMVTLVAFELGYLSPPVALNHLLTRQVVGEQEVLAAQNEGGTFYQRHERIIMPLIVMGISLLLVAFVPLMFYA
ncbi:TRAP-type C4-dicarboxylate transport system permease large subunit [Tamilnaduibacter salinus]|uniref:TRAP-type C4-dicarboxylate transport system permease large subunit n=1 Tax=Tamilnaduibacter salinus TaxID=1484056 RepID=A0A2U1CYQ9_9GAMM|nr:TRAP transporter large permease subunit [Tamilnaduibacter salinus]PVY77634.1 TRAP-type C4-dicarboxylate transport system permease large subunit [Tamilnaduibacter salinus]